MKLIKSRNPERERHGAFGVIYHGVKFCWMPEEAARDLYAEFGNAKPAYFIRSVNIRGAMRRHRHLATSPRRNAKTLCGKPADIFEISMGHYRQRAVMNSVTCKTCRKIAEKGGGNE